MARSCLACGRLSPFQRANQVDVLRFSSRFFLSTRLLVGGEALILLHPRFHCADITHDLSTCRFPDVGQTDGKQVGAAETRTLERAVGSFQLWRPVAVQFHLFSQRVAVQHRHQEAVQFFRVDAQRRAAHDADGQPQEQNVEEAAGCQRRRFHPAAEIIDRYIAVVEIPLQELVDVPAVVLLPVRRSQ